MSNAPKISIGQESSERNSEVAESFRTVDQNSLRDRVQLDLSLLKSKSDLLTTKIEVKSGDTLSALAFAVDKLATEKYKILRKNKNIDHDKKDLNINWQTSVKYPNGQIKKLGDLNSPLIYPGQIISFAKENGQTVIKVNENSANISDSIPRKPQKIQKIKKPVKKISPEKVSVVNANTRLEKLENGQIVKITTSPKNIKEIDMEYSDFLEEYGASGEYAFVSGPLIKTGYFRDLTGSEYFDKFGDYTGGYIQNGEQEQDFIGPELDDNGEKLNNNFNDNNGLIFIGNDGKTKLYSYEEYTELDDLTKTKLTKNTKHAFQNGPILLNNGKNPHTKNSTSKKIRSGMGVKKNGEIVFIHSEKAMNLYEFSEFIRKHGCQNAIYLDGGAPDAIGYDFNKNNKNSVDDSRRGFVIKKSVSKKTQNPAKK